MEPKASKPKCRARKRRRLGEENESAADETKSNNSKTRKRASETKFVALVGRYVLKRFGKSLFLGKIVSYDSGLYRVDYEDCDFEDMDSGELREFILEESNFNDDDLSRRKVRLDELVLRKILKKNKLKEKKQKQKQKKVDVSKNEVEVVKISAISELSGGMIVENDGIKDGVDSSSDSHELARDKDSSLEVEVPLVPPLMLPPSSGTIGVPEECVSHLFSVYGFLRSFSIILFLNPFELDDFVGSLYCDGPNSLSDAVHVALMRVLSCHLETLSSEGSELAEKCLRCLDWSLLDTLTWPVYLVQYFMLTGYARGPEWKGFFEDFSERGYYSLPVSRKLMILQLLCDDVLECTELRAEIDTREVMEVGTDPDAIAVAPPETGPKRVHPRYSKTSACKEREAMEIITESREVKSSFRTRSLGLSTESNAGVRADLDGNSEDCRLCGMDGTLLCCDGCPSAYHSRCIGVIKLHIPEGPWYCPECVIDKMGPAITVNTSLRGAELFGVDIYGQVFFGTCNHLLVLKTSLETESYLRYYNLNDIPKVLQVLSSSIQHKALYLDICKTIIHYWHIPENILSPLEMGVNEANIKDDVNFSTGSPLPSGKECHEILNLVDAENASNFIGSNVDNVGVLCPNTSLDALNQTNPPGAMSNGETTGGKDHSPVNKKSSVHVCIDSVMSAASISQQAASDVNHQSLVDRSSLIDHASCGLGNSSDGHGGSANDLSFQANMLCQSKVGNHVCSGRDARNSEIGYAYAGISFKSHAYVNHYSHGHFAATAAAKLADLSSEDSQVSEVNKSGSARKVTSTCNIFLQVKAFSSTASRFFWPSAENKLLDVPRERCGWCHSCKTPASGRRGCMLNFAVSTATKSASKILTGLPHLKNGEGCLPSIAMYILYMEESLRGLVAGSFSNPRYRKQWRNKMKEASTCNAIKALLLDLEENISVIALSVDWVKLMDRFVESSVIQSTSSTAGLPQKRGPGGRRRGKQSASEVTADDNDDKSFDWWRGGKSSTYIFQKAILPGSLVRQAAQQGGVRKIAGISYADDFEIPKRSRQLIWRAAVEMSKNAAQLAFQVRYLDLHVRWTDLVRPENNTLDGKGVETEASGFRNAIICDKKTVKNKIQYGVSFRNQKHLPPRVMKNIIDTEQTEDRKDKYWFFATKIPLYLIKEYEVKMSNVVLSSVNKPFHELSELQRRQLKASRRNIFAYLASTRDKTEKVSCASCQVDVSLRDAIDCGACQGYCHQDCILSSMYMNGRVERLITCKQCYHAKVTAQNETSAKSPTTPLPSQGRDCHSSPAVTKGQLASIRSKENSARTLGTRSETKQSRIATKRSKFCHWGVMWKKKNSDETGIDFRCANILTRGGSDNHLLKPICQLCEQPYNSDLIYIHCETCRKWYHAEAVEIEESRITDVVGFKCCKCRRIKGPDCPFMDPEVRELKRKKRLGKLQKQGRGNISNFQESKPISRIISTEDELVSANDPLLFSLSKVEQITENELEVVDVVLNTASGPGLQKLPVRRHVKQEAEVVNELEVVDAELNTASGSGLQKLPVRRHVKQETGVDGFAGNNVGHIELSTCHQPNDFVEPKEGPSIPFAEWDVSGDGLEDKLLFDYKSITFEDMEFEPQTYFSSTDLLASDDGDGQVDGNDAIIDDANAPHCHVCLQNEPAPELYCVICGFLMHAHCSPWPWDESSTSKGNWRCGRCREWR